MKTSTIKKMMASALTIALAAAPVMSVCATDDHDNNESVVVQAVPAAETVAQAVAAVPTTSSAAGVKSTTEGVYLAQNVSGMAVATPSADIAASYALAEGETPFVRFWDMDPKKSFRAKEVMDLAAASQGAVVGPLINIDLGKMTKGDFSLLPADGPNIKMAIDIPASFAQADRTFAIVCVRYGGLVSILEDTDDNPNTITFETTGGQASYAVIKY